MDNSRSPYNMPKPTCGLLLSGDTFVLADLW